MTKIKETYFKNEELMTFMKGYRGILLDERNRFPEQELDLVSKLIIYG
jgi:hypothetical protein